MMNRRDFLRDAAAVAVTALGGRMLRGSERAFASKPNMVIILADDLGWGSINCYGAPKNLVRTPNCDRLAQEGIRFTDANTASSVCSPTRYALVTGRYCWRTSLTHEVLGTLAPLHIETSRPTIASLLKKHGYRTAAVGKWHLGYGSSPRCDYTAELTPGPLDIGFDYHFAVPSNHGDNTGVFVENRRVVGLRSNQLDPSKYGKTFYGGGSFLGLDAPQRQDEAVMETLTGKAVAWLEQQEAGKPFFLYYTPVTVHHPVTPSDKTKGGSAAGPYGDWIHELDASVGAILGTLDRKGFTKDTLVIFTSDNGGVVAPPAQTTLTEWQAAQAGLAICGPWRGRKHSVYQGGFRVPFLARWPGRIPAGATSEETISLTDLLATTAALVGEPLPPRTVAAEDSYNVLPALLGRKPDRPIREALVVHSADGNFAIRQGPWKWIEGKAHPDTKPGALKARAAEFHPQLYHLAEDPGEKNDVLGKYPDVAKRLEALLNQYREQGYSRP
ncbi:MAG: arylsulfatase [Planctomycetes bacterium]|jgi:arylsulfatase A-like enzyme|nr:arylsulfatase [Planctomycetota bacterium]